MVSLYNIITSLVATTITYHFTDGAKTKYELFAIIPIFIHTTMQIHFEKQTMKN